MRTFKHSLRFYATGLGACALLACEQPLTPTVPPAGSDSDVSVENCRRQIEVKLAELRGNNVDVAGWSFRDATEMADPGLTTPQTPATYRQYDGRYRPLSNHPGCTVTNLYYDKANTSTGTGATPFVDGNNDGKWTGRSDFGGPNVAVNHLDGDVARIPGYPCAAKEYTPQAEDTSKPIVVLVHGNSTRPHTWEKFLMPAGSEINASVEKVQFKPDAQVRTQLAEALVADHYRVYAVDFRTDLVAAVDPSANSTSENAAGNIDHGWSTPILQSFLKALMNDPRYAGRKVAIMGHSLGVTVVRDALRRMYVEHVDGVAGSVNPFPRVSHVILGSGANHGVSTYEASLCTTNFTMRGTIVCEMGSRANYVQTYFHKPLNGPLDLFATPCADGDYAFGRTGQCGNNQVRYLTITMQDVSQNNYQDYYVSEAASRINMPGCVDNKLTSLYDYDTSGYFNKGFIANHFGSLRSDAGLRLALDFLKK